MIPLVNGSGGDGFETLNAAIGQPYPSRIFCRRTLARRAHETWPRVRRRGYGALPIFFEVLLALA